MSQIQNGTKLFLVSCGVIITCIIVCICFSITKKGKKDSWKGVSQIDNSYEELEDYNGRSITGQQVKLIMEDNADKQIYFLVKTKMSEAVQGVYYNYDDSFQEAGQYPSDKSQLDDDYINDTSYFDCIVERNSNGVIIGVKFIQD